MKCPQCGAENPPKNKFCGECGFNLKSFSTIDRMNMIKKDIPENLVNKILIVKDTIEKERRNVTVIFTDISGFTSMSEKLDPEEVTHLMNECFKKLSMMVYRYEGIIDKFIGDCIMAIFGAPVTHEDDPERAILACLDMHTAINEINDRLDQSFKRLDIHTGINTGEVIAGKVGSDLQMEYTVMGDTVNVAQRLKDVAVPGTIYVGPETYRRTRHAFDYLKLEPVQLKGKTLVIVPYEVIGRKWGSEYGLGVFKSDLVGRDAELQKLRQGINDLQNRKASVISIKGEIGVGKSRLLYELKKLLAISTPEIAVFEGRGVSYESSIPYKVFSDCLRRYLLASELHTDGGADAMIISRMKELMAEEYDGAAPYLFKIMNMELEEKHREKIVYLDAHSLQLQVFLAAATLFEKIAESSPLVIMVDDIQWADAATVDLMTFLLPMVKKANICFCLSHRVGDSSAIDRINKAIQSDLASFLNEITLGNLNRTDGIALIRNLAGKEMDDAVKEYIFEKSGGNPFFIEEIVRNMVESGRSAKKNMLSASEIEIPGSIETAVTSRIDALNKEARYLLKIASIIGRTFPGDLLEDVVREKDIYQHAQELLSSEFLVRLNKENSMLYSFRHPIFQEVAYNSLLKSERVIYHKIIAETIEAKFRDRFEDFTSQLANHYYICKNLAKAFEYSVKAGDEALDLYANEEALSHYNRALGIAGDESEKAIVLEKIAETEFRTGRIQEAEVHFHELVDIVADPLTKARITGRIADITAHTGRIDKGIELMQNAIKDIASNKSLVLVEMYYRLCDILLEMKAETEKAEELADAGISLARELKDRGAEADGMRMKGQILWRKGQADTALEVLQQCEPVYTEHKRPADLASLYLLMAAVSRAVENLDNAKKYVNDAISISERIGNQRYLSLAYNNLGIYYELSGDQKGGLSCYEKSLVLRQKVGDKRGEAIGRFNIGVLKYRIGEYSGALEYFEKARDIAESINEVRGLVYIYLSTGNLLLSMGRKKDEALALFEKALVIAQDKKDALMLCECYLDYGKHYFDEGEIERSLEYLHRAAEQITEKGQKERITTIYIDIAEAYIEIKDPRAIEYAEKGLELSSGTTMKENEADAYRTLGLAQALVAGDLETGVDNVKKGYAIASETNMKPTLAEVLFALGRVYAAGKNKKEAMNYLNQARQIYAEIGAKRQSKKINALIDALGS